MNDKSKGLYQKFNVERSDGSSRPGGKHEGCPFFVLDVAHDLHARAALRSYVDSCAEEYPVLASDLLTMMEMYPEDPFKTITINGVEIETDRSIISYETIKKLSGEKGILSVTYSSRAGEGSLSPSKSTDCVHGMIIDATNTSNA